MADKRLVVKNTPDDPQVMERLPAADYHARTDRVSASMVKTLLAEGSRSYEAKYVRPRSGVDEKRSVAMDIGTLAHAAILEPDRFEDLYVVIPTDVLAKNGAKRTNAYKDWLSAQEGRIPVKEAEFDQIAGIRDAAARRLGPTLRGSRKEISIFWDAEYGAQRDGFLPCKARLDILTASSILDIKCSAYFQPWEFASHVPRMGYSIQAAMYQQAYQYAGHVELDHLFSDPPVGFVVVHAEDPFEVGQFVLSEQDLRDGETALETGLRELTLRYRANEWGNPWEETFTTIAKGKRHEYQTEIIRWLEGRCYELGTR